MGLGVTELVIDALPEALKPDSLANRNRERRDDDEKFYKSFLYFFELVMPASAVSSDNEGAGSSNDGGETVSALFPLVINPEAITVSEPFTVSETPTVDGGLYVEENGILARRILLSGHTGFVPRPVRVRGAKGAPRIDGASYRVRGNDDSLLSAVSGQRHFQFLQDRVFRAYGDLKRDPSTAAGTVMYFHNLKDTEHWRVVPKRFVLKRSTDRKFLYRYEIELLAVDAAEAPSDETALSPDKSLFDKVRDAINDVKGAVAVIKGAIQKVLAVIEEVSRLVTGLVQLIGEIANLINFVSDFVEGVVALILAPVAAFVAAARAIESACVRLAGLPERVGRAFEYAGQSLLSIGDGLDTIASHPEVFGNTVDVKLDAINKLENGVVDDSTATTPSSLAAFGRRSSGPQTGDTLIASGRRARTQRRIYRSAVATTVSVTDTLESLAGRYLQDPRQWRVIAVLNNLAAPYISRVPLPRTVQPGTRILIPSTAPPIGFRAGAGVLGVGPELNDAERLLGRDLALIRTSQGFYDFAVDPSTGDFASVGGVENLEQAMQTRVATERGSNKLYPRVGTRRLVGIGLRAVDDDLVQLRLREAVMADPRILRVVSVRRNDSAPDVVDLSLIASVRGYNGSVTVQAAIV